MKIVIAPDSFKESLSAWEVANAIERGFRRVFQEAEYVKVPLADGGEGTVQALVDATGGTIIEKQVTGPLGETVSAFFGLLGDGKTAVIEMAAASGLHLVPREKRNPLVTTTCGTGELIRSALDYGVQRIIIGLGGSATNDGGAGMAQALGVKLLDENGEEIGFGGGSLSRLAQIDVSLLDPRLRHVKIDVACDVTNPLTGPTGASFVFGPQKGATFEMARQLDDHLHHYADIIAKTLGKQVNVPGAGAAGGLGAGLLAFLPVELKRGIDIVLEAVQFAEKLANASLVVTGEGRIDRQTAYGKVPIGVAKVAKTKNIPVIALAGSLADDSDVVLDYGVDALYTIVPGVVSLSEAMEKATDYIERTSRHIAASLRIGMNVERSPK
ncbi:glycerate kinase [Anoxybacteroides amylolyticum]|uniref:Glycerate kinase family protein n=1 Tax=Anoxybacteroides amylolyticum TaxID=294699 RepID=A0A167TQC8_9BACL|nr:glycerate kinase [Anoxybacillus amylolyticus]ANB61850.1 glycerate kinase family protein [Anoxybacillus amylolyticus]